MPRRDLIFFIVVQKARSPIEKKPRQKLSDLDEEIASESETEE